MSVHMDAEWLNKNNINKSTASTNLSLICEDNLSLVNNLETWIESWRIINDP